MEKVNKKFVVFIALVMLLSLPNPVPVFANKYAYEDQPVSACTGLRRMQTFMGATGFVFGLIPGFQPIAVGYGAAVVGVNVYIMLSGVCDK